MLKDANENPCLVDILVNDKPVRKYVFEGKIFVEARENSEYSIRVKNNSLGRMLCVCSVDGLSILNGKPATDDSGGYVINGLSSNKYDGFRVSDDKVAKFLFSPKEKNETYAQSKKDGSEINVGVIGIRLFKEKIKWTPPPITYTYWYENKKTPNYNLFYDDWTVTSTMNSPFTITSISIDSNTDSLTCGYFNAEVKNNVTLSNSSKSDMNFLNSMMNRKISNATSINESKGFDMGTKWGSSKESKVVDVEFLKGSMISEVNIYYASRENLIEMGVPVEKEKIQVSFPKAFKENKYAEPPKGWIGE